MIYFDKHNLIGGLLDEDAQGFQRQMKQQQSPQAVAQAQRLNALRLNPQRVNSTINNIPPQKFVPQQQFSSNNPNTPTKYPQKQQNGNDKTNQSNTVNTVRPTAVKSNPSVTKPSQPIKSAVKEEGVCMLDPIVKKVINEYMDIYDYNTLQHVYSLNEEEQSTLLVSLTNKLYDMIVGKIDEIDMGDIPRTRGDITQLPKYGQMMECINVLKDIFKEYREDTQPIQEIENAINNIEHHKDLFMQSYMGNVSMGIVMYNTMTLSCINALSFMIAVCIEYVKTPTTEGLKTVIDKTGIAKVKDYIVYENLEKWNDACQRGDIENSLRPLVRARVKNLAPALMLGIKAVLVIGGVLLAVLPVVRDLVYFFFAFKERVSTYFDIQADLLEMNAQELKNNNSIHTEEDKKTVIRRQLAIAAKFRKIADKLAVKAKQAENKADKDIKDDNKKSKIDDVETDPSSKDDGPLF